MEIITARDELERRLYYWALEEWKREIDSDFALLRIINDQAVRVVLKLMEERDRDNQLALAAVLVKRNRRYWLDKWQETYSEEEKKLDQLHFDEYRRAKTERLTGIHPQERGKPLTAKRVISIIREPLERVLNSKCKKEGEEWYFETVLGQWTIRTSFFIHVKDCSLLYVHVICGPGNLGIIGMGNFAEWLGAQGVFWNYEGESDLPLVGEAMARACGYFLSAVPKLVEGLEPD